MSCIFQDIKRHQHEYGGIQLMEIKKIYDRITKAISENGLTNPDLFHASTCLLIHLKKLIEESSATTLKMTSLLILFEGFYRSIPVRSALKNELINIRL